ncbi:hypothetical protein [Calothrix sp. 336/3]|uniref:hypothetical protein n=1 Tax=Calothrix sp. 336/3 TaxID=1337936 RepID=UPI00118739FF|nr:hypothetical protein [Calothrix sp. 336/3]
MSVFALESLNVLIHKGFSHFFSLIRNKSNDEDHELEKYIGYDLDGEIRIGRGATGNLFVFRRA